jgi:hypothetical protein
LPALRFRDPHLSYANPIWLEGRRKYWTRPGSYRFFKPGCPEAKMPGWLDPWATRVRMEEAAEDEARAQGQAAQEEFERDLLQLRWEVKKLKLEHELWCFEQKYSPDQPRVPPGSPQGGQWTSGANAVGDAAAANGDASADSIGFGAQANVIRICMLGSHMITPDRFGNQSWWADYVCADGFTFRTFGFGGTIRPFLLDPR